MQANKYLVHTNRPPLPEERSRILHRVKWPLFNVLGYNPHLDQFLFHDSFARFRATIAGTRGGKSYSSSMELIAYLFTGAVRCWVVGQTYTLASREFRYIHEIMTGPIIYDFLGGWSPIEKATYNPKGGDMYIKTKWGAEVFGISMDKGEFGAMGEEIDLLLLSEAAKLKNPRNVYERILFGRLTSRAGDVLVPTTPSGRTNEYDEDGWLFEFYNKGLSDEYSDYDTIVWPSWANPHFKENPYELRAWMDPRIFAEQYEAKFVVFSGAVFNRFDKAVHVIRPFQPPPFWNRYEAIDPGFSGRFVWISAVTGYDGTLYIIDEYSDTKQDYETRAKEIKRRRAMQYNIPGELWDLFANKHGIRTVTYIDPEDPQCAKELAKYGIPTVPADKRDILVSVDRVQRRLKYSDLYHPRIYFTANCLETIDAMAMHGWGKPGTRNVRKPANDKWKHWGDCVRYMCAGALVESTLPTETVAMDSFNEPYSEDIYAIMMAHSEASSNRQKDLGPYGRRRMTSYG